MIDHSQYDDDSEAQQDAEELDEALVALIARDAVPMPPFPAVALRVSRLLADESASAADIAKVVQLDQTLSASLVRAASSAAYARPTPVTSVAVAVQRLGAREVRRVVWAISLGGLVRGGGPLGSLRERVWRHAVSSAFLAQHLAERRGRFADEMFLCALLRDFGKAAALATFERELGRRARFLDGATWWRLLERHHVELGMSAAIQWGLPPLLVEAIGGHHHPPTCSPHPELIEILQAADAAADALDGHDGLDLEAARALPWVRPDEVEALLARAHSLAPEIAGLLNIGDSPTGLVSAVADETDPDAWRPTEVPIVVDEAVGWHLRYLHPRGLVISGPQPLAGGHLHTVDVPIGVGERTALLSVWGAVTSTMRDADGYLIDVRPYANDGPTIDALRCLLADTPAEVS